MCNGLTVNVTNAAGVNVTSFQVPTASLGGTYTQPITNLNAGSYTVAGSTIAKYYGYIYAKCNTKHNCG